MGQRRLDRWKEGENRNDKGKKRVQADTVVFVKAIQWSSVESAQI